MAFSAMSASESFSTRFPLKLWRLLNRCNTGAICWTEHGRSIKIDRRRFEREYLMPIDSAFKTSNFSSFVRQLNLYGFRKVINTFRFNQPGDAVSEVDIHEYHHPFFRRGNPDLLNRVQRRMKGRKDCSLKDCDRENSPFVSSLLKPLSQSTPKLEHIRFDRPPLHFMDINGQLVRQTGFPQATFTAPWSACQGVQKPTHHLLQTLTIPSTLRAGPIAGQNQNLAVGIPNYSSQPMVKPVTFVEPPKFSTPNIQSTPQVLNPGLPMSEAIHQMLGEKTISEMILSPAGNALSQSQTFTPFMPVLNSLCAPTTTSNLATNLISTINSDTFLSHALGGQSAFTLKHAGQPQMTPLFASPHLTTNNGALPAICHSVPTICPSTNSQLFTATDIPSFSHLPSIQDYGFQPMINLCPPIKPSQQYLAAPLNSSGLVTYTKPTAVDILPTADDTSELIQPIFLQSTSSPPENKECDLESDNLQSKDCLDDSIQMSLSQQASSVPSSPVILSGTSSPLNSPSVCDENFPPDNVTVTPPNNAATFLQQLSNGGFDKETEDDPDNSCYTPITQQAGTLPPNYVLSRMKLELH